MVGTKNAECNVYKKQSTKDKGLRFLLLFYSAWTQHFAFQECHSYQPTTRLYKAIPSMPCQCQSIERVVSPYLNCLLSSYNSEVLDCYRPKVTQVRCNTIAVPFFFSLRFRLIRLGTMPIQKWAKRENQRHQSVETQYARTECWWSRKRLWYKRTIIIFNHRTKVAAALCPDMHITFEHLSRSWVDWIGKPMGMGQTNHFRQTGWRDAIRILTRTNPITVVTKRIKKIKDKRQMQWKQKMNETRWSVSSKTRGKFSRNIFRFLLFFYLLFKF